MSEEQELARVIKDAYYHARDNGGTMHTAADDAAATVLALGRTMQTATEALESLRQFLAEECPHPADEHAEGTCEVCDWTFAIEAEIERLEGTDA